MVPFHYSRPVNADACSLLPGKVSSVEEVPSCLPAVLSPVIFAKEVSSVEVVLSYLHNCTIY